MNASPPNPTSADYNAKILVPLVQWLRAHRGEDTLRLVASGAAVPLDQLDGGNHWISQEQFETFLDETRRTMSSDDELRQAAVYRMAEGYGPMRFVTWATSPSAVYALSAQTYKLVSTVGEPEVVSSSRTALHARIRTDRRISRMNCLVRQAQMAALPTLWNLPPATIRETLCAARGDGACEYHLRYFTRRSWVPSLLGGAFGGVVAVLAARLGIAEPLALASLTSLGAAVGFAIEQQRTGRANLAVGEAQNDALRELAAEEAEARRELLAMHQRQRDWTRMLEEDAAERAATIQGVVEKIRKTQEQRERQLRGFSHDLRSPLTVIRMITEYLAEQAEVLGAEGVQAVADLEDATERMHRMLRELMEVAQAQTGLPQLTPEPVEVEALTERLRRRLRAMVYGRDIRASVFRTREAPDTIYADPLLIDRITDNLLSNASKYTERGSIVVEVEGAPGFLVLKISDSGRGMAPESLERVFAPAGSEERSRATDSYGLGLSVVVQLLHQIGGRLEVMSKPGLGTTFWVYLPIAARIATPSQKIREGQGLDDLVHKVVKIRKVKSA